MTLLSTHMKRIGPLYSSLCSAVYTNTSTILSSTSLMCVFANQFFSYFPYHVVRPFVRPAVDRVKGLMEPLDVTRQISTLIFVLLQGLADDCCCCVNICSDARWTRTALAFLIIKINDVKYRRFNFILVVEIEMCK